MVLRASSGTSALGVGHPWKQSPIPGLLVGESQKFAFPNAELYLHVTPRDLYEGNEPVSLHTHDTV